MAAGSLDMALDDLVNNNKRRHRRPAPSPSMARRAHSRAAAAPYHSAITCFQAPPPVAYGYGTTQLTNFDTPTKLYISNLDYAVSNEDIKELFSELGDIKRYSINYDKSGRSKGTAEVVFSTRSDALAAVKKYNNVHLDGKPMKIELIGTNIQTPVPVPPPAIFGFAAPAAYFSSPTKSGAGRGGRGWARGRGGFGGRGRGHVGRGQGRRDLGSRNVSAEELDADLDKYHAEGMQIS